MKIHIDTSSAEEQAKAQKVKAGPTSKGKGTASSSSAQKSGGKQQPQPGQQPAMPGQQQQNKPTRPLTKKPPNEPRAPKDVQAARKQQTAMLKARQDRETQGKQSSFQRDADVGAGFWPPIALW